MKIFLLFLLNPSKANKIFFPFKDLKGKRKDKKVLQKRNGIDLPYSVDVTTASTFCFSGLRQNGYYMSLNHKNTRHEGLFVAKCDESMNLPMK